MKTNQKVFLLLFVTMLPLITFAQTDSTATPKKQKPPLSSRLAFGGNIGLSFGTVTYIEIAPIVGYRASKNLTTGIGLRYIYYKDNYYHYTSNIYGGTLFGRYNLYKGFFTEADFEANNVEALTIVDPINQTYTLAREWIPSLLLGVGYSSGFSGGVGGYFSIMYDVIQNPNSPYYQQPIIRAGIGVGF